MFSIVKVMAASLAGQILQRKARLMLYGGSCSKPNNSGWCWQAPKSRFMSTGLDLVIIRVKSGNYFYLLSYILKFHAFKIFLCSPERFKHKRMKRKSADIMLYQMTQEFKVLKRSLYMAGLTVTVKRIGCAAEWSVWLKICCNNWKICPVNACYLFPLFIATAAVTRLVM